MRTLEKAFKNIFEKFSPQDLRTKTSLKTIQHNENLLIFEKPKNSIKRRFSVLFWLWSKCQTFLLYWHGKVKFSVVNRDRSTCWKASKQCIASSKDHIQSCDNALLKIEKDLNCHVVWNSRGLDWIIRWLESLTHGLMFLYAIKRVSTWAIFIDIYIVERHELLETQYAKRIFWKNYDSALETENYALVFSCVCSYYCK